MATVVGERALGGEVVHDGTIELAAEPAGLIGAGKAEGPGPRTVVGGDLVAREVVVLDEHDMAGAIIVSFARRGAGRNGERNGRDGGRPGHRGKTGEGAHGRSSFRVVF